MRSLRCEWMGRWVVGSLLGRCIFRIWLIGLWFDSVGEVFEWYVGFAANVRLTEPGTIPRL